MATSPGNVLLLLILLLLLLLLLPELQSSFQLEINLPTTIEITRDYILFTITTTRQQEQFSYIQVLRPAYSEIRPSLDTEIRFIDSFHVSSQL